MLFSCIIFGTVFCIPFNLSQHEMTKFLVWGPRKKKVQPPLVTLYLVFVMGVDLSLKPIKDLLYWHVAMILLSNHV